MNKSEKLITKLSGHPALMDEIILAIKLEAKIEILEEYKGKIGVDAKKKLIKYRNQLNHIYA